MPSPDDEALDRLTELLPEESRDEFRAVVEQTISHSYWLPPPEYLARYEAILPGLAERIVQLPEREQAHRHRHVEAMATREFTVKRWGQNLALVAMTLVLSFCVLLALLGEVAWPGGSQSGW